MILANACPIVLSILSLSPNHEVLYYLDPGSGSFLLQILIGTLIGALVILRSYWSKIRALFSKDTVDEPVDSADQTQESDVSDEVT